MQITWKKIASGIGIISLLVGIMVSMFVIDERYAKAADVKQSFSVMAIGVQIQMDTQQLDTLTAQQYRVKKYLANNPDDVDAKEEIIYLREQIKMLRGRVQNNTTNLTPH